MRRFNFVKKPLSFILILFGSVRMLVLIINKTHNNVEIIKKLNKYAKDKELEFEILNASALNEDDIKGEFEIIHKENAPYSQRKRPKYWPTNRKMIVVEGLSQNTDIEILRAFLDIACLNNIKRDNIPRDKLPIGSGFIFIADDDFPFERFNNISECWSYEAKIFELDT